MKNYEIKVWLWKDAPQEIKDVYEKSDVCAGGDEDYVFAIKVPEDKDAPLWPVWVKDLIDASVDEIAGLGNTGLFRIGDTYYNVFSH